MLLSSLQTLVLEQDFELRFVICELFLTFLQTNTYKTASETSFLLSFLLKQVAIHDEEIKEKVNIFEFSQFFAIFRAFFRKTSGASPLKPR